MSRAYDMNIRATKLKKKTDGDTVKEVIESEWPISYGHTDPSTEDDGTFTLFTGGEGQLYGGETEEEFTSRVTQAIWDKLGYYAEVTVAATYLDDLPTDTHSLDQHDYEAYLKEKKEKEDGEDTNG